MARNEGFDVTGSAMAELESGYTSNHEGTRFDLSFRRAVVHHGDGESYLYEKDGIFYQNDGTDRLVPVSADEQRNLELRGDQGVEIIND